MPKLNEPILKNLPPTLAVGDRQIWRGALYVYLRNDGPATLKTGTCLKLSDGVQAKTLLDVPPNHYFWAATNLHVDPNAKAAKRDFKRYWEGERIFPVQTAQACPECKSYVLINARLVWHTPVERTLVLDECVHLCNCGRRGFLAKVPFEIFEPLGSEMWRESLKT